MEFLFPLSLRTDNASERLSTVFQKHGASPGYLAEFDSARLKGLLRGFIDLVFRHDDKWYLADYKSNHLGSSPQDYDPENLARAMEEHDYTLQYQLYAVALIRYLRLRQPNFDPEIHFGGVYYFFLRGMLGADSPGQGVFFANPSTELLLDLERALSVEMPT